MLYAKDFRRSAWLKLSGNWLTAALVTLIYCAIFSALSALPFFGAVLSLIFAGPLSLGLATVALNLSRGKSIRPEQLFHGFRNFLNAFLLYLLNTVFIALWSLLFVIPGIVKSLSYSMSTFILADNPGIGANEARIRSMQMMEGNKWRLFCLLLSFLGWIILCGLTFGILWFFVSPYIQVAMAEFYREIGGQATPEGFSQNANGEESVFGSGYRPSDDASKSAFGADFASRTGDEEGAEKDGGVSSAPSDPFENGYSDSSDPFQGDESVAPEDRR